MLAAILELTKLDAGVVKAQPETFALSELLDQSAREAAVLAQSKGLSFKYVPSRLGTISDAKLLKRVVQNLLANALRYTPSGKILLGVKRQAQYLKICVCDTGVGISEADQQKIFDEFQQGSQADQKGLGIGLAISQRICSLLGHQISFSSVPGKGSCFSVQLPLMRVSQRVTPQLKSSQPSRFTGQRILLMDNEAVLLQAVSQLLQSWHCDVKPSARPARP